MSIWLLYLMTRTEALQGCCLGLGIVGMAIGSLFFLVRFVATTTEGPGPDVLKFMNNQVKSARQLLIGGIVLFSISGLFPSKADWYVIVGGYYVTHVDNIDKLAPEVVKAATAFLEQYAPMKHEEKK